MAAENAADLNVLDTRGLSATAETQTNLQEFLDAVADRVVNKLVTKAMMSGTDTNDANKVPTSALLHTLKTQIDTLNSDMATALTYRKNLGADEDLDDIRDIGVYYQSTQSNIPENPSDHHYPEKKSGFLEVIGPKTSNVRIQRYTVADNTYKIYIRRCGQDKVWQEWKSITPV